MTAINQALLCAGQGAQAVGMGSDLSAAHPECKALFEKANDVLGYDLATICFNGPESELLKTVHCQNAIFVTSVVCLAALRSRRGGQDPAAAGTAGLSLGEWTALHIAGAVSFEDALRALHARGQFMQEACEERDGAMLSVIGLPEDAVRKVASSAGVELANLNSPEQIVLSGERKAIMDAEKVAGAAGAKKTVLLKVAGAYHSSLMASAARRLEDVLAKMEFRVPRFPVVSNVTAMPHGGPDDIRRNMALQVTSSVRWVDTIRWFEQQGVERYIEFGPGRVLSGLVKRIQPGAALCNVQDTASLEKTLAAME